MTCHDLREVFNALRWMVRTRTQWRFMPNHFPPWAAVHQQTQRWIAAGVFAAIVHDLRMVLRLADVTAQDGAGRGPHLSAVILDGTVLQSTPESGPRAGYSGAKRKKGSKLHLSSPVSSKQRWTAAHQGLALCAVRRKLATMPMSWTAAMASASVTDATQGRPCPVPCLLRRALTAHPAS